MANVFSSHLHTVIQKAADENISEQGK